MILELVGALVIKGSTYQCDAETLFMQAFAAPYIVVSDKVGDTISTQCSYDILYWEQKLWWKQKKDYCPDPREPIAALVKCWIRKIDN